MHSRIIIGNSRAQGTATQLARAFIEGIAEAGNHLVRAIRRGRLRPVPLNALSPRPQKHNKPPPPRGKGGCEADKGEISPNPSC